MGAPFMVVFPGVGESALRGQIERLPLRDGAQLLHHSEQIPADPFLYDLSVLDAVDGYTHPSGPFVGRLQAH